MLPLLGFSEGAPRLLDSGGGGFRLLRLERLVGLLLLHNGFQRGDLLLRLLDLALQLGVLALQLGLGLDGGRELVGHALDSLFQRGDALDRLRLGDDRADLVLQVDLELALHRVRLELDVAQRRGDLRRLREPREFRFHGRLVDQVLRVSLRGVDLRENGTGRFERGGELGCRVRVGDVLGLQLGDGLDFVPDLGLGGERLLLFDHDALEKLLHLFARVFLLGRGEGVVVLQHLVLHHVHVVEDDLEGVQLLHQLVEADRLDVLRQRLELLGRQVGV